MRNTARFSLVLLFLGLLGFQPPMSSQDAEQGRPKYAFPALFDRAADPQQTVHEQALFDATLLWERLYHWVPGADGITLEPNAADGMPKFNEDRTSCEVKLRKDAVFNDSPLFKDAKGRVVQAGDVVFVFKRIAQNRRNSMFHLIDGLLVGLDEFIEAIPGRGWTKHADETPISGITVADAHTVRFEFTRPFGLIAALLAHPAFSLIPPEAVELKDDDLHPNCPLMCPWDADLSVLDQGGNLVPRASYWGTPYLVAEIDRPDEDLLRAASRKAIAEGRDPIAACIEADLLDVFPCLSPSDVGDLMKTGAEPPSYVQYQTGGEIHYLAFNMTSGPCSGLTDKARNFRRAISFAIDAVALAARINENWDNAVFPADGPLPPGCLDGRGLGGSQWTHDIVAAGRALAASPYPDGIDTATGEPLELRLLTTPASISNSMMAVLRASLEAIGVKLKRVNATEQDFLDTAAVREWDLAFYGWRLDSPIAGDFLQVFHSRHNQSANQYANLAGYASEEFDTALAAYESLPIDKEGWPARQELASKLVALLASDRPMIPIFFPASFWIKSDRVELPDMPNCCFNTYRYIRPAE
jgi:ABC-type transport system substrate-binding protein